MNQGAEGVHKGNTSKAGLSGLENSQARTFRNLHRDTPRTFLGTMVGMVTNGTMAGVFDEWNDDWISVGWHDCWEQTYGISASLVPSAVRNGLNG